MRAGTRCLLYLSVVCLLLMGVVRLPVSQTGGILSHRMHRSMHRSVHRSVLVLSEAL